MLKLSLLLAASVASVQLMSAKVDESKPGAGYDRTDRERGARSASSA